MATYTKIVKTDLADGALYDKVNDMVDAVNAAKPEGPQIGFRKASTAYTTGAIRSCEYHPEFFLKCTTSGTSGSGTLDTSGTITAGQTLTDGGVVWTVVKVGAVQTINNTSPDGNGNITIGVSTLNDAVIASPTDGQALKYDSASGKWVNGTIVTTTITYW